MRSLVVCLGGTQAIRTLMGTACDSVVPRATHLIAPTPCAVNWFILASLAARDVTSVSEGVM